MVLVMHRRKHQSLSPETLAALIERTRRTAIVRGQGCFEAWNGRRLVWVRAKMSKDNRVFWRINDERCAEEHIVLKLNL